MMSLKNLCSTFILTLALAASTFAGTMEGGEIAPPSSPATATTQGGVMDTPLASSEEMGDETSAADTVTEAALRLLASVFALF
jgi:hypothetical protein